MTGRVDLDNTDNCLLGHRCESCGTESPDLAVHTVNLGPLGVACLTLDPACAASSVAPPVSVSTAARLVAQHAAHLGITIDQAQAAIEGDR